MFYSISENKGRKESIRVYGKPLNSNRVNFTFGLPEWQQKYSTTTNEFYTTKNLIGNRLILNKEYLTPNYSGFKLIHFPQKEPFLTSNKRDFIEFKRKEEEISKLNEKQKKFLRESKIEMGNYKPEHKSMYGYLYENPSKQVSRFDYDKINFKYNPYNLHPIRQELILKDPKNMNPFDYYNKDKDKHYVTNKNVPFINKEYLKVWDPITNRYFPGSLRSFSQNQSNQKRFNDSQI